MKEQNKSILDLLRSKELGTLNTREKVSVVNELGEQHTAENWHQLIKTLHQMTSEKSATTKSNEESLNELKKELRTLPNGTKTSVIEKALSTKVSVYKVFLAAAMIGFVVFLTNNFKNDKTAEMNSISLKDHNFLTENFNRPID
ncbi:MAG: hypothetical protein HKN22_02245 [Bacteroidia bacterium]|nr:hypothetical protein [Bacteroidia bacterium]